MLLYERVVYHKMKTTSWHLEIYYLQTPIPFVKDADAWTRVYKEQPVGTIADILSCMGSIHSTD